MFFTLSNGRKFVIHFHYTTQFRWKSENDQFGRTVDTTWYEHNTKTSIYEWFDTQTGSRITFEGLAHCSYKDKYNKRYGRDLSLVKALMEMKFHKQIDKDEFWEIAEKAGLDGTEGARIVLGFCSTVNDTKDEE